MSGYNYEVFTSKDYDFDAATGPQEGDKAPDFDLTTPTGAHHRLLDFDGDFLVLEMGSLTCPLFQTRRPTMERLAPTNARVSHAILYVREAHPGADIPQHQDIDAKRACAARLTTEDGETRLVLVDDFEGNAHLAYGGMPNTVFIINANGCVMFRAEWNNPGATQKALNALLAGQTLNAKSYFYPAVPREALRVLRRAGKGALPDFLRSLPVLIWNNLIKRNLRTLMNKPQPLGQDTVC
jgi:hypothetical protein